MNVLYVILITILLAGCGPSAEKMTATAVMAQAQTQTAAPTFTPTSTPAPSPTATLLPTITPTPRPRAKDGEIVSHLAPGEAPIGMPEAGHSIFFPESSSGFLIEFGGSPVKVQYALFLEKGDLPGGAVLEIHFENPTDPSTAFTTVVTDLSDDTITVLGKLVPLSDFKCQNYWMDVHIYSDGTSTQELGTHVQWVNFAFC